MKRKRFSAVAGGIYLILVLAALLLPACAKQAPPAPTTTSIPTAKPTGPEPATNLGNVKSLVAIQHINGIRIIDAFTGKTLVLVTSKFLPEAMAWSSSGKELVFSTELLDSTRPSPIYRVSLSDSNPVPLEISKPKDWFDFAPIWGNQGKEITYFSQKALMITDSLDTVLKKAASISLFKMDVSGQNRKEVSVFAGQAELKIAYQPHLFEGWPELLYRNTGTGFKLSWSSDRNSFAYLDWDNTFSKNVFVYKFGTGNTQLSSIVGEVRQFEMSPDGNSVTHAAIRVETILDQTGNPKTINRFRELWISRVGTNASNKVFDGEADLIGYSPDSKRVLFTSNSKFYILNSDSLNISEIKMPTVDGTISASWMRDGENLFVTGTKTDAYVVNAASGKCDRIQLDFQGYLHPCVPNTDTRNQEVWKGQSKK